MKSALGEIFKQKSITAQSTQKTSRPTLHSKQCNTPENNTPYIRTSYTPANCLTAF